MDKSQHFTLAISRQLGSGGTYIGQEIAKRFDLLYVDRAVIDKAAGDYSEADGDLETSVNETSTFWERFLQAASMTPGLYVPPEFVGPTLPDLYEKEAKIIKTMAKEHSAVFVGRCAAHILKDNANCAKLFLHADNEYRMERVEALYAGDHDEAKRLIAERDEERVHYWKTYAEREWTDARNFDLSIDTGKLNLDKAVVLVEQWLRNFRED